MSKSPEGWKRRFDDPIPLPGGRQLVTLEDAGTFITKLPKAEHSAPEWRVCDAGTDPGRDQGRPDDAGAHRRHAGATPKRGTGVQFRPERSTLGEAKAGTGSMISAFRFSLPEGDCRGHGSEMKEAAN
jgi:hypothetical protein